MNRLSVAVIAVLIAILPGCRSKPMTVYDTKPPNLDPASGILKGPYEIQNEAGRPIGVKTWTEGEIKQIE